MIPTLHIHLLGVFRLLWPDSTEAQAHFNLRTLVGRLRQALPYADSILRVERTRLTSSRPSQIEPFGVGTSESDRSETRTTQWKVFWESL